MSTTVNRAPRKTLSLPKSAANVRAATQQGEKVPRTRRVRKTNDDSNIWVHALANAEGMHRDALQLELAVGLSFYAERGDAEKVSLKTKKAMRDVYESAGYACKTHLDEEYKTVARRIGVSADLYVKLGGKETISDWVADVKAEGQVDAVMEHLKTYKFTSLNSVMAYIGKPAVKRPRKLVAQPVNPPTMTAAEIAAAGAVDQHLQVRRDEAAAGERRLADKLPPGRVFKHGVMEVAIPFEATYADVVALANELLAFAKTQMPVMAMAA